MRLDYKQSTNPGNTHFDTVRTFVARKVLNVIFEEDKKFFC